MGSGWLKLVVHEGAEIGYCWLAKTGARPRYAFGHGLSYTSFGYSDLAVSGGETITVSFTVTNTGSSGVEDDRTARHFEQPRR
jgi:beta-glucosidase